MELVLNLFTERGLLAERKFEAQLRDKSRKIGLKNRS